jgi:hypothetical protein
MEFRLPLRMNIKTIIRVQNVEHDVTLMEGKFCLGGHSSVLYPNWQSQPVSPVYLQASYKASKPVNAKLV